jgi:hypothetical protein
VAVVIALKDTAVVLIIAEAEHRLQHDPAQIGGLLTLYPQTVLMDCVERDTKDLAPIKTGEAFAHAEINRNHRNIGLDKYEVRFYFTNR